MLFLLAVGESADGEKLGCYCCAALRMYVDRDGTGRERMMGESVDEL